MATKNPAAHYPDDRLSGDNTYAHRGWEITNTNTYGGYVPKTYTRFGAYILVDPCAGDGEAIVDPAKPGSVMTGAQKARE